VLKAESAKQNQNDLTRERNPELGTRNPGLETGNSKLGKLKVVRENSGTKAPI
jgi:hypothetical protein